MQLIPIPRDGSIKIADVTLPDIAKSMIAPTVQVYERSGYVEPWVGYLAIEEGKCVGTCGFTSPPVQGVTEIAYFTFPDFERRGVGTRMAQRLVSIAQACDPTVKIIAHTLTGENASTRILRKLGFEFVSAVDHPEDGNISEWSYEQKSNPA